MQKRSPCTCLDELMNDLKAGPEMRACVFYEKDDTKVRFSKCSRFVFESIEDQEVAGHNRAIVE